jgi:hypothetical protein
VKQRESLLVYAVGTRGFHDFIKVLLLISYPTGGFHPRNEITSWSLGNQNRVPLKGGEIPRSMCYGKIFYFF